MHVDLAQQLTQAGAAFVLGLASGLLYDIVRILRRRVKSFFFAAVCDGAFWRCCFSVLYLLGLSIGDGQQRGFLSVFAVLGGAAYLSIISRFLLPIMEGICRFIVKILAFILSPLKFFARGAKKISKKFKNLFHLWKIRCRIWYDSLNSRYLKRKHSDTEDADLEAETIRYTY